MSNLRIVVYIFVICICHVLKWGSLEEAFPLGLTTVYYIEVSTSSEANAGTDADVYIMIHGEAGVSSPTLLKNLSRNDFGRGAVDDFWIISKDVGAVSGLEVKLNSTENTPSWAFDYIKVKRSNDSNYVEFNFADWLEPDRWIKFTLYYTEVATSDKTDAGSDANIYIKIHGDTGVTTELLLDNKNKNDFVKGAIDKFSHGAKDVGAVTGLDIQRKDYGSSPDWAFDYIEVKRSNDTDYTRFNFSDWLEVDKWIKFTLYDIKVTGRKHVNVSMHVFIKIHGSVGVTTALLLEGGDVDDILRGAIDVGVVTGVEVKYDSTTDDANVDPSRTFFEKIKVKRSNDSNYVNFNVMDSLEADRWIKFTCKTCSEIKLYNPHATSGSYVIDPDGDGSYEPFTVHCDMTDKNGVGVTVVGHDSENRTLVKGYESRGSYVRDINYTGTGLTSNSQLFGLLNISTHCEQFIKYECYHTVLLYNGDPWGWWVSRDNVKMTYWGGATPADSYKCACGVNNTCANSSLGCNCDKNDEELRNDSGLLTEKSHLPVLQLRFGDTGHSIEYGYHTLGKLKCYGGQYGEFMCFDDPANTCVSKGSTCPSGYYECVRYPCQEETNKCCCSLQDRCLANSIGLSDPNIVPDSQMTASSTRQGSNYRPAFGRLGDERGGGWCAQTDDSDNDWLEVSLGDFYNICRVDTQGDAFGFAWTTAFKLNYSINGIRWNVYKKDNGTQMEFYRQGNATTVDKHHLPKPVVARYIRFLLTNRHKHNCLRVEVYGTKAYHFNVWLTIPDKNFTMDLLMPTSVEYWQTETEVMNKFIYLLNGSDLDGFLLAELLRFGAQTRRSERPYLVELMADIIVFTTNCSVKDKLIAEIKFRKTMVHLFNDSILEIVDTENCTCPLVCVNLNLTKDLRDLYLKLYDHMPGEKRVPFSASFSRLNCSLSVTLRQWHIIKVYEPTKLFEEKFLASPFNMSKTSVKVRRNLEKDVFFYVSYVFRSRLQNRIIGYDYGYLLVKRDPPIASIFGPSNATKGEGNITLNGSLSYNPQLAGQLNFTWLCRRIYETFSTLYYTADRPNVPTNFSSGCFGYGPGMLSVTTNVLVVNVDKMEEGQAYVFELIITSGQKTFNASHQLTIYSETKFRISCSYNCGPTSVDPGKQTIVESHCTGLLCKNITLYEWHLFQLISTGGSHYWKEVTDLDKRIETDGNNPNIVLSGSMAEKEYSLKRNTSYKINGSIEVNGKKTYPSLNEITFKTMPPLLVPNNTCKVTPSVGVAYSTNFTVDCAGWQYQSSNRTYSYRYNTSTGLVILESETPNHLISTSLPGGRVTEDFNVTILVVIYGKDDASHTDKFIVKVKPSNTSITSNVTERIDDLLNKGDVREATTLAISSLDSSDDQTKDNILGSMAKVHVTDISEATQLTTIGVLATRDRDKIPLKALEDTASVLNNTIIFLLENAVENRDLVVRSIGRNTLEGLSNILEASPKVPDKQAKGVTERTLLLVDSLATALLSIKTSGQKKSVYDSNIIKMRLQRQTPANLGNKSFSGDKQDGNVTFPSAEVLFGNGEDELTPVDVQIVTFKENPYLWADTSTLIKSSLLSLDLKDTNGSRLNVSNLSEPIKLFIPIDESKKVEGAPDHLFVKSRGIRYHKIKLKSIYDTAFIEIKPENDTFLDVFVSAGVKPKPKRYTFKRRIPDFSDNSLCANVYLGTGLFNCAISRYMFSFSSNVTGDHYIGIRLVDDENRPSKNVLRSVIKSHVRQKRWWITVKEPPTTPISTITVVPKYNNKADVNYSMSVKIGTCLYWAENKQDWTSEGCKVGSDVVSESLQCVCNHLSAFGGNIFVAPNPIDFKKIKETLGKGDPDDFVVLVTVCIIFGIYFIGLVLARRADKSDKRKVVANVFVTKYLPMDGHTTKGNTDIVDNPFQLYSTGDASKENVYHLSILTGMWINCGTSANVSLIINGDQGSSGVISLTDPLARKKLFSRGSVNNFILALPNSLGKLIDICIWHDNKGSNPAWFLQDIFVTNQQTEEEWYFFANRWLSLDKRGGNAELYLEPRKKDRLASFKPLCYGRTARNLSEGHIWISLFTRPPQNPFTRCQRLSCCLSLLFTAMATNAAFYQFGDTQTDTFKFGPLVMSWKQIKIGIQSSVIAILPNLLVTLMFKNIRSSGEFYDTVEESKKPKSRGFLPPFFLYIAWLFCLAIALTGATITVLYSLEWGADKSNPWLTSILVSTFQDILINQPVKLVAFAIVLSLLIKKPPEHETVIGPSFFQSAKVNQIKATPTEYKKTEKEVCSKNWDMAQAFKEFVSFLVLSIILMFVVYAAQDPSRYQFTNSTISLLGDFDKVDSKDSLWKWIENDLLLSLYNTKWYNGQPFEYKEGFISDKQTFMLGMPRLRQLRVKKGCHAVGDLYESCRQPYSSDTEDQVLTYGPKWTQLEDNGHLEAKTDFFQKPWKYQNSSETNTSSHYAVVRKYGGGGFIADLGYNITTASNVVRELKKYDWLDERTAAVFIEFTLFNPSTSLFCNVRNAYEVLPTNQAVTSVDVRVISLYPSSTPRFQSFYEACQLIFLVVILIFVVIEIVKCVRERRYFRQVWNWVELTPLLISIAAICVSFFKAKYTTRYVKRIQKNPYETFSSDAITSLLDVEILLLSLAIFLITLKLLRLTRFNPHIGQMYGTLKTSARPIMSFSALFFVACVAFTQFLYLTFGAYLASFASFTKCLQVLLYAAIGKSIGNKKMHETFPALAYFYVFLFFIVMVFVLINIFVAILVLPYEDVRKEKGGPQAADAELGRLMYKTVLRKMISFPGKLLHAVKLLRKNTSKVVSRKLKSFGTFSNHVRSMWKKESPDEVEEGENALFPPLASPEHSDIEDSSDEEDYATLEDIKIQLTEISSELNSLNYAIINNKVEKPLATRRYSDQAGHL